ncbi:MAG TPA: molybdopterin-dependent oxidoreductase [Catalimonadaceae bacterium]|nr:molybdopterin-dependent oxidoreductase [Catalimonadaceae bacterium]HPI11014.1 molybdopterin-dependent oxidoreductase [Catalimonadaceae bacterium]
MKTPFTRNAVISWLFFFGLGLGTFFFLRHINKGPKIDGIPASLRQGLERNEQISRKLPVQRVLEFPKSAAVLKPRANGKYGLKTALDSASFRMQVVNPTSGDTLSFTTDQLKALPKTEVVFDFKCIEGWNQITWWAGLRFSDFIRKFYPHLLNPDGTLKYAHVGLMTPDKQYYVGIDAESMMHPQTLLCYEMSGQPLPLNQGYPLRLIIPVKYGIKHLKRIGYLYFSKEKPKDFWAERGYDYDAGH